MTDGMKTEMRDGYPVAPEMKKLWAVELDLLRVFLSHCERHGLKCWVEGGTLLGAVRHKGFIPWDDDLDVAMMRDDYDRLCQIGNDGLSEPYFLQTAWSPLPYAPPTVSSPSTRVSSSTSSPSTPSPTTASWYTTTASGARNC